MQGDAHLDFETGSAVDLMKAGVMRYVEHETTRVWCFSWCIGDGPVFSWRPGFEAPAPLLDHIANGKRVVAHNANFERLVWRMVLPHYTDGTWPALNIAQQSCTMARAHVMNLPASLEKVAKVLVTPHQKDMAGSAAMKKLAKPRKIYEDGTIWWWDDSVTRGREVLHYQTKLGSKKPFLSNARGRDAEKLLATQYAYCDDDVHAERDVDLALPALSDAEQRLWEFDQVINERGVRFDIPLAKQATELVAYSKKQADKEMRVLTDGHVKKCTEVGKLATWLNDVQGVPCESVKKGTMKEIIFNAEVVDNTVAVQAVQLRKDSAKTSTAKYAKTVECYGYLDRLYFLLAYHAASTGRWGGRLVQPQNFPRFDDDDPVEKGIVTWIAMLLNSDMPIPEVYDHIHAVHGSVLPWLAKALRSMIVAAPGKKFIGGDFSNIEGRSNVWLANEQWKLDAFTMYDLGAGPDLYKVAYANSFGVPVESVVKTTRQIGKVQELASGYQGGVGAYISMAEIYDIELYDLARTVKDNVPSAVWDDQCIKYASASDKHGLYVIEWTALKLLVNGWRGAHVNTVRSWWAYQDAALAAVQAPGHVVDVADMPDEPFLTPGRIRFMSDKHYLYICLPNGRTLNYAQPWIEYETVDMLRADGTTYTQTRTKLMHMGIDSKTKQWSAQSLYGGKLCENIVQAVSRDIMVDSMYRVEEAGYPIILTVHDEILSEPVLPFGSANDFKDRMAVLPAWAGGLPLAVAAWEDQRYVK